MAGRDRQAQYQEFKRQILALGWARPGCVIQRYMACGNPSCRCMATPPALHGPYGQWSHKIAGKTRSMRLSQEQARLAKEWAENYRKLKKLLRRMEQVALQETDHILGAISSS